MPYKVVKGRGSRPWKIKRADTGQVVGSSVTQAQAYASVRARMANELSTPAKRSKGFPK